MTSKKASPALVAKHLSVEPGTPEAAKAVGRMIDCRGQDYRWVSQLVQSEILQPLEVLRVRIEKIHREAPPELKNSVLLVMDEVRRIEEGSRALSRPPTGDSSGLRFEEVRLLSIVDSALLFFRVPSVEDNVSLELEIDGSQIVNTDIFLFQQFLMNLLQLSFLGIRTCGRGNPHSIYLKSLAAVKPCLVLNDTGMGWDELESAGAGISREMIQMNLEIARRLSLTIKSQSGSNGHHLTIQF